VNSLTRQWYKNSAGQARADGIIAGVWDETAAKAWAHPAQEGNEWKNKYSAFKQEILPRPIPPRRCYDESLWHQILAHLAPKPEIHRGTRLRHQASL